MGYQTVTAGVEPKIVRSLSRPGRENRTMLRTRLDPRSVLTRVSPCARRTWERVATAFESAWVAFPLILIVQLKVIWRLWAYRDVTLGDTTQYFAKGCAW